MSKFWAGCPNLGHATLVPDISIISNLVMQGTKAPATATEMGNGHVSKHMYILLYFIQLG